MKCPKCGYVRQVSDEAPDWQCPNCKVVYEKVLQAQDEAKVKAEAEEARRQESERQSPSVALQKREQEEFEKGERLWLAARGQKIVIYCIVLNFCLGAVYSLQVLPDWAMTVLDLGIALYAVNGILKICTGLKKSDGQKILFIVSAFLPLINLIALVYLSIQTTQMLRAAGWEVGLFGAKLR